MTVTGRRWALVSIGMVLAVVACWMWFFGGGDRVSVADLVQNDPALAAVDATVELCADLDCEQGWRTRYGNYLQFTSVDDAHYWVAVLGDEGRIWRSIVLDMHGVDLTFEQRRYAVDVLLSYES